MKSNVYLLLISVASCCLFSCKQNENNPKNDEHATKDSVSTVVTEVKNNPALDSFLLLFPKKTLPYEQRADISFDTIFTRQKFKYEQLTAIFPDTTAWMPDKKPSGDYTLDSYPVAQFEIKDKPFVIVLVVLITDDGFTFFLNTIDKKLGKFVDWIDFAGGASVLALNNKVGTLYENGAINCVEEETIEPEKENEQPKKIVRKLSYQINNSGKFIETTK